MKFAEHLNAHITPEWRKQYILYEDMKNMLYTATERMPSPEVADPQEVTRYIKQFDEEFFAFCEKELAKINTFYAEKMAEATRKFSNLKSDLQLFKTKQQLSEISQDRRSSMLRRRGRRSTVTPNDQQPGEDDEETGDRKLGMVVAPLINKFPTVIPGRASGNTRKLHELKLAFSEFYLSLVLLQDYQNLNFTGFRKILKKHDKLLNTDAGQKWRQSNVECAPFYTSKDCGKIIEECENLFTTELEAGDRQKAMKRLRVPPLNDQGSRWTTFKVGFYSGAFIALLVAVILSALFHQTDSDWRIVFRLYRGSLLIILFLFLIGINVYGWRTSGVNHVLIFELDPRDHLSEQDLCELAAYFAVIWAISVLTYLYSTSLGFPPFAQPLALVVFMVIFLVNPTPTFRHNARFWLLKVLSRVACAPFVRVNFADFWLADQLNSLVPVFLDFQYFLCFYSGTHDWYVNRDADNCVGGRTRDLVIRTLVACLPAWFRFAQCLRRYRDDKRGPFPHLVNAGKYSTTFFVVIFSTLTKFTSTNYELSIENPFFILWLISMAVSSCYTYLWDIKMDWGLFDSNAPKEYKFLREEIVYSSPNYYYFAIIEDLILRFGWTLSVSLTEIGVIHADLMLSILAPLEIFRRFVWNFFRLENEHLNNCGEFRAVRDISIAPIDAGDQEKLIKAMDDKFGVTNRKPKTDGYSKGYLPKPPRSPDQHIRVIWRGPSSKSQASAGSTFGAPVGPTPSIAVGSFESKRHGSIDSVSTEYHPARHGSRLHSQEEAEMSLLMDHRDDEMGVDDHQYGERVTIADSEIADQDEEDYDDEANHDTIVSLSQILTTKRRS